MQNFFDNEATSSTLHATMKPARGGKCLVTLSTYEDRKEALLNTTILDDAGTYRSKATKGQFTSQNRQQNDTTLDSREAKQEAHSHIPKPPPLQMTSNNNTYKNNNNNNNHSPQTASYVNGSNKSLDHNDQLTTPRVSNTSQNSNTNIFNGKDTNSSRSNKTPATSNTLNANRQTLRLGTVTIGEYRQPTSRREPEKFDFISTQKRTRDSGDTTPTNEALQSELQNTLTRANLRKSNGNSYTEHQRNCPLHQQQLQQRQSQNYDNNNLTVEEVTKKLQKSTFSENNSSEMLAKSNVRSTSHSNGPTGVGILKNGSRNGTSSSSKSVEKSIKFG